jgi:hypothetical protein
MKDEGCGMKAETRRPPDSSLIPHPSSLLWGTVLVALTLVMWARFLLFPSLVAGASLDPSWMQALGHFYRTDAQAGTDYVFTYGPLGFFATWTHDPDLYWQRYLWELGVKLAAAVVISLSLAALPSRGLTLLGLALVIVFVPYHFDTIYQVALLAAGLLLLDGACRGRTDLQSVQQADGRIANPSYGWPAAAVLLPLLALLALTKFTYFVLALWAAALAEAAVRLRGYRGWLSPVLLYLACVAAVWLYCGQRPAHLWAYCRNSWEIAAGYGEAMSVPAQVRVTALALVALVLAGFLLLLAAWRNRRSAFHVTAVLLLGPGLFLGWKHGLTRSADGHPYIFCGMALYVAAVLPRLLAPTTGPLTWIALGCVLACSVCGILLTADRLAEDYFGWNLRQTTANVTAALHPAARKGELEEERVAQEDRWRLDRVRAAAGAAPVDQLSCEQGVVLLNGLNWRPRPVFQSYTAYTPALLRLNAEFFRSAAAPDYLLCNLSPIDNRLGAMEDSLALLEVLRRYYPLLREEHFVLFRRVPPGEETPAPEPEVVCRRPVRFGEEVSLAEVSGDYQVLALRFSPSAGGLVRGALYKRDSVLIDLRTASGRTLQRRVIPAMAQEGFLINPLVDTTDDYVRLYGPAGGDRVVSFTLTTPGDDFKDAIEMTVTAWPLLPCRRLEPGVVEALSSR